MPQSYGIGISPEKQQPHRTVFQKPTRSEISANSKTVVYLPQRGEKEVLEDIPLFVCYDTTFTRKGKISRVRELQNILQYLLPSTVKTFPGESHFTAVVSGAKSLICVLFFFCFQSFYLEDQHLLDMMTWS